MANDVFDLDSVEETSDGFRSLRKAYERLTKDAGTLREEIAGYKTAEKASRIANIVKAKGLPEKVAGLYQGDDSEEAITKWVADYSDVFGATPPTDKVPDPAEQEQGGETLSEESPVPAEVRNAQRRISALNAPVDPAVGGPVQAAIAAADSPEAVMTALKGLHTTG